MLGRRYEFSEEDLEEMGEALLKADEIRADSKIFRMVQDYLAEKGKRIEKLSDRREEKSEEYENMSKPKSIDDLRKKIAKGE